jgi:hypothetical protein
LAVSCFPVVGTCGVAAFAVVSAVASVDAEVVAEPLAAGPSVFPWPVFGVTGAVALVRVVVSTGVKSAVVAGAPELVTGSGAETAVFAVVLSAAVVVVGVVPVSALPATEGPGGGASGCELAAIAAAAMASGAVGPPGVGVGVGAVLVAGADVGIATATGVGVAVLTC